MDEKKDRKHKIQNPYTRGLVTGIAGVLVVLLLVGGIGTFALEKKGVISPSSISKALLLQAIIKDDYYQDVKTSDLQDGMYEGIMEGLDDPYSQYYTAKEYQDLRTEMSGKYAGIGAVLTKSSKEGNAIVVKVYDDSPAQKAGLASGDEIVSVDGKSASKYELDDFVQLIRGEEDSVLEVEALMGEDQEEKTLKITRENIKVPTVTHQMLDDRIGYLRIDQFNETTYDDYMAAMEDLTDRGMQAIVFDVRANGGGLVDSVTKILDDILPEGTTVYMLDKEGNRTDYTSSGKTKRELPMTVLVDGNTASAAEIFSGAIRDFDYGTIIGTQTFGKGIVQRTIQLADGSAVKLTVETYYTPSGECIHKKGIKPDIELEYEYHGDKEATTTDTTDDNQVEKAVEVLNQELDQ